MAEWLCRGLQILVRRFDSGPGLQFKVPNDMCNCFTVYTHQHMERVIQEGHCPEQTFLCLPLNAPATMGMGMVWGFLDFLKENHPTWTGRLVVACGSNPGYVLSALRHGIKRCIFNGHPEALKKLKDIAQQKGAKVDIPTGVVL